MRLTAAADSWHFAAQAAEQSPRTLEWKRQKLDRFIAWCAERGLIEVGDITATHVQAFLLALPREWSSYTRHGYAQVLKTFLRYCVREDLVNPKLPAKLTMPKVDTKVIETFRPEQLKALLKACDHEFLPWLRYRDRALIAILLDTGIRVSELCNLTLADVHFARDDSYLTVFGKGRKERQVGLGNQARMALHTYVHRYREAHSEVGEVFVSRDGIQLTPHGIDQLIKRLADWAGISGVRCSAHTFRHTFAVNYLAAGGDVYKLSRLLGHESVTTTEVYLRAFQAQEARRDRRSVLDSLW